MSIPSAPARRIASSDSSATVRSSSQPFAAAALWWTWADWSGYTKRKAMEAEDQRKLDRINRHREAIGQKAKTAPPRRR